MLRPACPICESPDVAQVRKDLGPHPYLGCPSCEFFYQRELKPKVYEAHHEAPGDTMSLMDRQANKALASWLYGMLPASHPPVTLDIGAKYPYLAHCLGERGADAYAIDGIPEIVKFAQGLRVKAFQCDFEGTANRDVPTPKGIPEQFDLITMVHMIEHLYEPLYSCRTVWHTLKPGGLFFIRCPAHDVPGIERDFTPGHYDIHPQIWGAKSLLLMAEKCGFAVEHHVGFEPGQRDLILRKV